MSRKRRQRRLTDGLFVSVLVAGTLGVLILLFDLHRIRREPSRPESPGRWTIGTAGSMAAVVVNRSAYERQATGNVPFSRRDFGMAWLNTLEQEVGSGRAIDVATLTADSLQGLSLVVLSAGAGDRLSPEQAQALEGWTRAGGALIAELPVGVVAGWCGRNDQKSALTSAAALSPFEPDSNFLPPRTGLERLPIFTRQYREAPLPAGSQRLASLSGWPAIVLRSFGRGCLIDVRFDFGLFLTATQQGRPEEDGTIHSRYPALLSERLESNDLMVDSAYYQNAVPVADLIERALVLEVRRHVLLPALWYWPDGASGVYCMTHDDEGYASKAEWMPLDEATRGVPSTCFLVPLPELETGTPKRLLEGGHAVGLHWNRYIEEVAGLPRLGPFLQEVPVIDQAEKLGKLLPTGEKPRLNRLHYLAWMPDAVRPFRQMEAAGIELDSSYGPDFKCRGYLFGTGFPFRPLDASGLPLRILELPYQHSELDGGTDSTFLSTLARGSRAGDHTAIVSLFHPPFWLWAPSVQTYRLWRTLPAAMRTVGQTPLTMSRVLDFMRARGATRLSCQSMASDSLGMANRWRLEAVPPEGETGLWLTLPEKIGADRLEVRGAPTRILTTLGDSRWQGIPLSGPVTLELSLQSPRSFKAIADRPSSGR